MLNTNQQLCFFVGALIHVQVRGRRNFETVKDVVDRMASVFNERFVVEPGRDSNVEGGGVVVVGNESITEDDAHIANKRFKQEP